jgi:hypothetical protein
MTYTQLVAHFGGLTKAADALGLDRRHVWNWSDRRIPSKWQVKAEHITNRKLKADPQSKADAAAFLEYAARAA